MSLGEEISACAALVERADPWRFRCAMAAPVKARAILFPLYAFNVEVARAPWLTTEPMIAEMRLQWWRDVLEEIARGDQVRRHEVTTPLAQLLTPQDATRLDQLVAARRWDIYRDPFEDEAHLDAYIDQTAGHLMWTAARLLGAKDEVTLRDAAYAAGIAQFLRAVPELADRGRVPLLDGTHAGVQSLAKAALDRLARARRSRSHIPKTARAALLPLAGTAQILQAAITSPARVADAALPDPTNSLALNLQALTGRW